MTVSALRTIAVMSSPLSVYGLGSYPVELIWPQAEPDDNLDYSLDLTIPLGDVGEIIDTASIEIMPSGAGELAAASLSTTDSVFTVYLSGGVAGRTYTCKVIINTASGRIFEYVVLLPIDWWLATYPFVSPPDAGFGPAQTTAFQISLDFSQSANSGLWFFFA